MEQTIRAGLENKVDAAGYDPDLVLQTDENGKVIAGKVQTEHFADGAVTREKIADGALTNIAFSMNASDLIDMTKLHLPDIPPKGTGKYVLMFNVDADKYAFEPIKEDIGEFKFVPATTSNTYSFQISAAGKYAIHWGDGNVDYYEKNDTNLTTYSHTYADAASNHEITLRGKATAYNNTPNCHIFNASGAWDITCVSAIIFGSLKSISGSIGSIFSTLKNGDQPRFIETFRGGTFTSIPENLFDGLYGQPTSYMFTRAFAGISTTSVPANLFSTISGKPTDGLFTDLFVGSKLISIPAGLLDTIKGPPQKYSFRGICWECPNLASIPDGLFAGVSGAPAEQMFQSTFTNTKITSIPEHLFGNISGSLQPGSFSSTFAGCTSLTGPSAKINGKYLYQIWPSATTAQVGGCYGKHEVYSAPTKLSDYSSIPRNWK